MINQYNGQISVDKDNQIIVGHHLSCNANDKKEMEPAIEEIQKTTGKANTVKRVMERAGV